MPAIGVNGPPQPSDNAPPRGSARVRKLSESEVQNLLNAAKTPRARELEGYQAFFDGTAYEGRVNFFDDSVPMQERKPCVIYPLCMLAAESNVAFAMGEGRFPVVLSLSSEGDDVFDKTLGLSKDDSAIVDSFNAKLIDLARLEHVFRQGYRMAMASRSVAFVLGFRAGLPFADLVWSKLCTPKFEDPIDPCKCTRLEIRYRYTELWRDPQVTGGEWWTRVCEYLRVVDERYDAVYRPVDIWDVTDAGAIAGRSPTQTVTEHGFGFCPVHWYPRNRASTVTQSPDGLAIHDGMCGLLEQLDLALSQRHRAAVYAGDPQTVLIGVDPDATIGGVGRAPKPMQLPGDVGAAGRQWQSAFKGSIGEGGPLLKRGVGQVWKIEDPQGKAVLLTLAGDALKALDDDAKDLASKACDGLGVTIVDPSAFSGGGDLSGRTLAFIFSKQINRVSQDREDVGRCAMLPVLNLFYRMLLARPDGVYLPGLQKVLPILQRFYKSIGAANGNGAPSQKVWFSPQLKLKWGDYFEPSDVDESTRTQTAINAYNAKLITIKSAVEHIRGVFAIGSVDQYVEELSKETEQRNQDEIEKAQALKPPAAGNPAAGKSPNAAPPASGAPKAVRKTG
jgi:hypothetical protein